MPEVTRETVYEALCQNPREWKRPQDVVILLLAQDGDSGIEDLLRNASLRIDPTKVSSYLHRLVATGDAERTLSGSRPYTSMFRPTEDGLRKRDDAQYPAFGLLEPQPGY